MSCYLIEIKFKEKKIKIHLILLQTFLKFVINSFFSSDDIVRNEYSRSVVIISIPSEDCWRLSFDTGAQSTVFISFKSIVAFFFAISFVFSPNRIWYNDGCGSAFW